jgi:hypothetical protein
MPVDRWGHPYLYPSKPSGFFWQMKDNIKDDSHMTLEGLSGTGTGTFTIHFSGPTSPDIFTDPAFENTNSIGGCDMDFAKTETRGYIYKSNDPRDIELKFLASFSGFGDNGFSVSGSTGRHSGDGCCSGFSYMFSMEPNTTPVEFRFRKEMWHVSYHDHSSGRFTNSKLNFKLNGKGYVGVAYVRYNKKDGRSAGHDSVILEGWMNPTPDTDKKNWILVKRIEDKGGWGNDGDDCNGVKDQVGTWGGPKYRLKSNDDSADITFKNLSLREIDPLASFDDNPTTPPPPTGGGGTTTTTSTIQGTFRFSQDINSIRASACQGTGTGGGGGGETGNTEFYNVTDTDHTTELSNTSTFQNRTRVAEQCANSSSPMKSKVLNQLDVWLKKEGSPAASPTARAKIWTSGGSVRYTSPTILDPSTLTTSFTKKVFDFSANTVAFNTGDYVGIEYITTSDTNYILIAYGDKLISNCYYMNYEDGAIETKPTTRDLSGTMWE